MTPPPPALDRYTLREELPWTTPSRRVFRALDRVTGTEVALKRVPARAVRRELTALMVARLPGMVELLDHWVDEEGAAIVTRWIDGQPFPGIGVTRWPALAGPTLGLLDVVDRLHRAGVVHRDLKPTNVLVDGKGRVVVLDLGIATGAAVERRPDDTEAAGTLRYAAPEQVLGDLDPRSDLYAVGVMVYEALTGVLPHDGNDLLGARLALPPVPVRARVPDLDPGVAEAVDRLLCQRPEDRFADAREAARALGATRSRYLPPVPVTRAVVRGLLRGPERVAHLPSRAAELLWRTTGGRRDRLEEALGDWRRGGVVDGALRLDPARFEALASAERGATSIHHLRYATPGAVTAHAVLESRRCRHTGEHDHAVAVLRAAVAADPDDEDVRTLVAEWELHALALGTPTAREDLLVTIRRRGDPGLEAVERTLEAARLAGGGEIDRALAAIEDLDTLGAHLVRLLAARVGRLEVHREAVARLERWAADQGPFEAATAANARGLLLYREGQFREATVAHLRAARTNPWRASAIAARLNAVAALLEIPDPTRALREAGAMVRAARRLRHPGHEAVAEVVLRMATYRSGAGTHVDVDLVDALEDLSLGPLAALAALTESAVAWRMADERAVDLLARAERNATASRRAATAALASALRQLVCGAEPDRVDALGAELDTLPPGVAAQVAALLGAATGDAGWRARAAATAPWTSGAAVRREVLSPDEVRGGHFA